MVYDIRSLIQSVLHDIPYFMFLFLDLYVAFTVFADVLIVVFVSSFGRSETW